MATIAVITAGAVVSNGHAKDYGWLSGEVERSRLPQGLAVAVQPRG